VRGRATRRAVAKANGRTVEKPPRREADGRELGDAKVFPPRIDGQRRSGSTGVCTDRVSRRKLKAAILESLTAKARTVWILDRRTLNVKDPLYNQPCWERGGRNPDLRMRPVKR
jgi:hypothetical protein